MPGQEHPAYMLTRSTSLGGGAKTLKAARRLPTGTLVHSFAAHTLIEEEPSHWTLQLERSAHANLSQHVIRFINHACEPNVVMRGALLEVSIN